MYATRTYVFENVRDVKARWTKIFIRIPRSLSKGKARALGDFSDIVDTCGEESTGMFEFLVLKTADVKSRSWFHFFPPYLAVIMYRKNEIFISENTLLKIILKKVKGMIVKKNITLSLFRF